MGYQVEHSRTMHYASSRTHVLSSMYLAGKYVQPSALLSFWRVAHYSDMLTKKDQRHVEDTLSLNRQSRVEQEFNAFISDERIDTCIMIQKKYREKTVIDAKRLTSMMFEVSAFC